MIVQVKKENNNNNNNSTTDQQQQQQTVSNKDSKDKDNKENNSGSASSKDKQQKTDNNNIKTDSFKKFENEGVSFKAKLIGSELVLEPRGDKMCQNSIQRLKAIIKGTNAHKRRVVLKISLNGVKVYDEKTNEILHHHEVSQISFIASDDTDSRSFGYVGDVPNKAHQFVCFKTSGPAITVITIINSLFEAVVEKKKQLEREKQEEKEKQIISDDDIFGPTTTTETKSSTYNSNNNTTTPATNNNKSKISSSAAALAANLIDSPAPPPAQTSTTSKATSGLAFTTSFTPSSATSSGIGKDSIDLIDDSGIMAVPWPSTPIPVASSNNPRVPNRSLIYNHSSVSLSEAPINQRQSSFTSSSVKNDSYVDSVNKPIKNININSSTGSILEPMNSSSSAANMMIGGGSLGNGAGTSTLDANMFRRTNPFDDDFFA